MQTKAKIFGLASFCAHVNVPDLWCSFPLPPCYYHSRQWSPMHSTHTQATCQYLVDRYSSISDSPAASFGHGCDINFFANFECCIAMNNNVLNRRLLSSYRNRSNPQSSHIILAVVPIDIVVGYALCFDRRRLYDTPDVVVHHRHREVPSHQQTPSYIVSIDVLTSPIPSHIDWHRW